MRPHSELAPRTTTSHDALLEHRAFLLRLARSLVRDESTAQDFVQDASAAYLASPPREEGASKAWLALVVRRLAGKRYRSRVRIADREAAVARPESEPSGIDALDRQLDAQSVLIELVQGLPTSQREAVQLRYHNDLSPKPVIFTTLQLQHARITL